MIYKLIAGPLRSLGRTRPRLIWFSFVSLLFLPLCAAQGQYSTALEFRKLLQYAKENQQPELVAELENLSSGGRSPVYIVFPSHEGLHNVGVPGDSESESDLIAYRKAWSSQVIAIYREESTFSTIAESMELFIQEIPKSQELPGKLNSLAMSQPPELFDGDLVVLGSKELADLRRLVQINRTAPAVTRQLRAIREFVAKPWDKRSLFPELSHPGQLTLITGMRRGGTGMTIVHCLPTAAGALLAFDVETEMQEIIRELVELVRSELIPVSFFIRFEPLESVLDADALGFILTNLVLEGEQGKTVYNEFVERRSTEAVVYLLASLPREVLQKKALFIALRSGRFRFIDPQTLRRVESVPIFIADRSGALDRDETSIEDEKPIETRVRIVNAFTSDMEHEDFRVYRISATVTRQFSRTECLKNGAWQSRTSRSRPQGRGERGLDFWESEQCEKAKEYLDTLWREIQIASKLGRDLEIFVISDVARDGRSRDAQEGASAFAALLRKRAEEIGPTISVLQRLQESSESNGEVEVRLVERAASQSRLLN